MYDDDRWDDPEFKRWAKSVKINSNFECAVCQKRGVYLESHHMNSWDWCVKERFDLLNGIALCSHHHHKFHDIFGWGGNHKWQFEQFKKSYNVLKKIAETKTANIKPSSSDPE